MFFDSRYAIIGLVNAQDAPAVHTGSIFCSICVKDPLGKKADTANEKAGSCIRVGGAYCLWSTVPAGKFFSGTDSGTFYI